MKRHNFTQWISGIAASIFMPFVYGGTFPPLHEAVYALFHNSLTIGEAKISLSRTTSGQYNYRSESRTTGLFAIFYRASATESVDLELLNGRLRPLEYSYIQNKGDKKRNAHLLFDWNAGKVINQVDGSRWSADLATGTLDKFSTYLALMQDLTPGIEEIEYEVADGGKVRTYRFTVLGEENLKVPMGNWQALKLAKQRKKNRNTYIWAAPNLNYLPVKIEKHGKKDVVRMELKSLRGIEPLAPVGHSVISN